MSKLKSEHFFKTNINGIHKAYGKLQNHTGNIQMALQPFFTCEINIEVSGGDNEIDLQYYGETSTSSEILISTPIEIIIKVLKQNPESLKGVESDYRLLNDMIEEYGGL